MVVVDIGTYSGCNVAIMDAATNAGSTYSLNLRPEDTRMPENWSVDNTVNEDVEGGLNIGMQFGKIVWEQTFRRCKIAETTDFENLKKAFKDWTGRNGSEGKLLFLVVNESNGSTNEAKWPDESLAMQQIRCRVQGITVEHEGVYRYINIKVKLYSM